MQVINFDNNATTKLAKDALAKMNEVYGFSYNPSSTHSLGRRGAMIVENVRQDLSDVLNAQNYDIYFTSGGTESNNMALFGDDYEVILFAPFEHSAIYNTRPKNAKIIELKCDDNCVVDLTDLKEKLETCRGKNFLVSLMHANAETGAIQPLKEVAKLTHQNGGLIHSDLVQSCGKIDVDLEELNIDFASISAHKINGPQGVGAFFARRGLDLRPLIYGGGQEFGKRSGTHNVAGIAGFGVAALGISAKIAKMADIEKLRDFIEAEIAKIAGDDVVFFAKNVARTKNTSYMALRGANSQTQLIHFDLHKIMISAGSACSSGSTKPSRVLTAMNVAPEFLNAMRVSLGAQNTMAECEEFVKVFNLYYNKIKK